MHVLYVYITYISYIFPIISYLLSSSPCRVSVSRCSPIVHTVTRLLHLFFMAISHFIVQLTVTFTHTHTHAVCGRGQPTESRVPAKCVVCCRPPPFPVSPAHHIASIVQTIAGLRVACFGFCIGRANFVWCV